MLGEDFDGTGSPMEEQEQMVCPSCGLRELHEDAPGLKRCHACGHIETDGSLPGDYLGRNPLA